MGILAVLSAFAAGLASFVSPCVLPLVPVYLAQLVGPSVWQGGANAPAPPPSPAPAPSPAQDDPALAGAPPLSHDDSTGRADHIARTPSRATAVRLRSTTTTPRTSPRTTPAATPIPSPRRRTSNRPPARDRPPAAASLGRRATVTVHAAAFVAGFGLVFVALGASASALGALLAAHEDALRRLGAVALALFGLHVAGVVRLPWLERERRFRLRTGPPGYLSSLGLGVVFGFGWTPCVGPYLAGILVLAAQARTLAAGVGLLVVYALGLGVPFLLVGAAFDRLVPALRRLSPHLGAIERASGALLLLLGVVLWFDWLPRLSSWFVLRV
jgi:cytochrome c-type biogenesis protein